MNKFILIVLLLFVGVSTKGQVTTNSFEIDNNDITWQKVFDTSLSFQNLVDIIKATGLLKNIEIQKDKIFGDLMPIDADFKGAGYSEMSTPIYVSRSDIGGFFVLEYKEGKYRVTIRKMILTQKYSDGLTELGEKTSLETYGLKKGKNEMTNAFKKSSSEILNYTFNKKFNFKAEKKNNW